MTRAPMIPETLQIGSGDFGEGGAVLSTDTLPAHHAAPCDAPFCACHSPLEQPADRRHDRTA